MYQMLYSVPEEKQEQLSIVVHQEIHAYYSKKENQGKPCEDISLNVALEFTRKAWLYADEGSPGALMIEQAMQDSRFQGLIIRS